MPWFHRLVRAPEIARPDRSSIDAAFFPYLVCANCGTFLLGDPDEDPTGDGGKPICGECERNRNVESMLEDQDSRNRHG